jgi:predicted metal-dependent phosphoesterase TrpH
MLVDLHCHTLPLSTCSSLRAEELVDLARERGLDGICLTEHDRLRSSTALAELRARTDFVVLGAVELTTDMGHVLGFGLPEPSQSLATGQAAYAHAQAHGGLLYLAHPARDGLLRVDAHTVTYFESVEAINGSDTRLQNMSATGLAKGFRLPGIGGSDCHSPDEVGRAATEFETRITDEVSLVAALRNGAYRAVSLA